jgi:hypothetical protein
MLIGTAKPFGCEAACAIARSREACKKLFERMLDHYLILCSMDVNMLCLPSAINQSCYFWYLAEDRRMTSTKSRYVASRAAQPQYRAANPAQTMK